MIAIGSITDSSLELGLYCVQIRPRFHRSTGGDRVFGRLSSGLRRIRRGNSESPSDVDRVQIGALFARINATQVTETARILRIEHHRTGIPHVRYDFTVHRAGRTLECGPRILALPTFLKRFHPQP